MQQPVREGGVYVHGEVAAVDAELRRVAGYLQLVYLFGEQAHSGHARVEERELLRPHDGPGVAQLSQLRLHLRGALGVEHAEADAVRA